MRLGYIYTHTHRGIHTWGEFDLEEFGFSVSQNIITKIKIIKKERADFDNLMKTNAKRQEHIQHITE